MPKINQVKIEELVAASKRYVDQQVQKADVNKNGYVSGGEVARLAPDLKDNFAASQFKQSWGSVKTADLAREFTVMMEAFARSSDGNRDGYLSVNEALSGLPQPLRDNFSNFLASQESQVTDTGTLVTRNTTPATRVKQHLEAFGQSPISYDDAFKLAVDAAATDEYGLAHFVREFGGPDGQGVSDPAEVEKEVAELLRNGSMELLAPDEEIPTGETNEEAWIFSIRTDGQGDHGMWAIVDRQTGETTVSSFN